MLKGLFAALLLLSLAGKAVWSAPAPEPDGRASTAAIVHSLRRAGFEARIVVLERSPGIVADGVSGRCRIVAGDYPVHGTFQDVYRQLAAGVGPLRFVHHGTLRDREPKLAGLIRFYLWRELRRVGVAAARAPVIAVAASESCDLARIPWGLTARVAG